MGGRAAERLKRRRSMRQIGVGVSEEASGAGPPGGSRLLLLLSLSNFLSFAPPPSFSQFIWLSLHFLLYSSPTFSLLRCLFPCLPQSEDRLLAGRCCRGGRASESLMRCLSPQSRLDRSSQQRTTTTAHCTVLHTVPCLLATAAAEGVAGGKVCMCVSRRCVEATCEGTTVCVCVCLRATLAELHFVCVFVLCTDISE